MTLRGPKDSTTVWTLLGGLAALASIHVLVIVPATMSRVEVRIEARLQPLEQRLLHRIDRLEDFIRQNR